jgi:serine/threonine protein kinase
VANNQLSSGRKIDQWTLMKILGQGGNGQVWLARDEGRPQHDPIAIKVLSKMKSIAYTRFRDEVRVLRDSEEIQGILPVLDAYLPEEFADEHVWYSMPVATPICEALQDKEFTEKVIAVMQIAETVSSLHGNDIIHRDIKPANLLFYSGRYVLCDFGLVDFPGKEDVTGPREEIGAKWTIAPEIRRNLEGACGKAADVYSLAKTLWILLTGNELGFDGQYVRADGVSLKDVESGLFIEPLEDILTDCTDSNAENRPSMAVLAEKLHDWVSLDDNFHERNLLEWMEIQKVMFPGGTPTQCSWEGLDKIVKVLGTLGERSNSNHLFLPSGGGLDLTGANRSNREADCIELYFEDIRAILKPKILSFESFSGEPQWSYFRLDADRLKPCGVYEDLDGDCREEVTDLGTGDYLPRHIWDQGEISGRALPGIARVVIRYLEGAFVIFPKAGIYNRTSGTYDARHNSMSASEFRSYIEGVIKSLAHSHD